MSRSFILCLTLCTLLLVQCGTNTATAPAAPVAEQSPEAVSEQWTTAMRENDRVAALALVGDLGGDARQTLFVDQMLNRMRGMLDASGPTGGLVTYQAFPPVDDGKDKLGLSRWTYAKTKRCYVVHLTPTDQGWKVINWGESTKCPA